MSENTPTPGGQERVHRGRVRRGLHARRRRFRRTSTAWRAYEALRGGRGWTNGRDRGCRRGQARGRRQAGDPEGDRPQHQVRPQVGRRRWCRLGVIFPPPSWPAPPPWVRPEPRPARYANSTIAASSPRSGRRDRPGRLRHPRPGVRPRRRRDPQRARGGPNTIVEGAWTRRGPGHQGGRQGSPGRGRLVADRHAPTAPPPGVVWSWSGARTGGAAREHLPHSSPFTDPQLGAVMAIGVVPVASVPLAPLRRGRVRAGWSASWRPRRCSSAPSSPSGHPSR